MINLDVPGWGNLQLEHLVLDFNGTISFDGKLIPGVKERLQVLAEQLQIHIITADTFGTSAIQCQEIAGSLQILNHNQLGHTQKEKFVQSLGPANVVAIGNGANDVVMLEKVALGISVLESEGLCVYALTNSDLMARNICDALDLLIHPKRLIATLRK